MNLTLCRSAFALIFVSLVGGFFVPNMAMPRLGLSAHTIGALSGALMIAIGAIWQHFRLSAGQAATLQWAWIYSSWANWLACLTGAVFGAGMMTPLASGGMTGSAGVEALVAALFISVGLASLVAAGLSFYGLRGKS